jgi:hypothetical protein
VEHYAGHLLLLANCNPHNPPDTAPQAGAAADAAADAQQQCRDYSLFSLPAAAVMGSSDSSSGCAARTAWQLLLAESPDTAITDLDAFQGALVLHEMRHSTPGLRLLRLSAAGPGEHLRVTRQQQVRHTPVTLDSLQLEVALMWHDCCDNGSC